MVKAIVNDGTVSGSLEIALLTNNVTIEVRDAGQFRAEVVLANCQRAGSGIRCSGSGIRARIKRTRISSQYRLRLTVRQLATSTTGAARPVAPVRLALIAPGISNRVDVISDCVPIGTLRLGCRDRDRPNIIFVVSDDQRSDTLPYMPQTLATLADQGITFTNAFVTSPVCAPSRASMLAGQYARHHGVHTVGGAAAAFVGPDQSTLATWLHDAGYRTGMYGKYLTDYSRQCPPYTEACYIPPGWDEWHVFLLQKYYNYALAENEQITIHLNTPADYSTDVLAAKAVEFIDTADGQPFFLHVGFHAPHQEGGALPAPAPRHAGTFATIAPWRPPSYDEDDISDKPPWLEIQPRAGAVLTGFLTYGAWGDVVRQLQLESLLAVDEAIAAMIAALEATGQLDNTVFVYTSDNGHFWGEHRFFYGKNYPYEESIRIPLLIRYPRMIAAARVDDRAVLNIDIAPTLAELAGVPIPSAVDGASMVPLLRGEDGPWRTDFVVELWGTEGEVVGLPTYAGVRSDDYLYVAYPSATTTELYDLVSDPNQLTNVAGDSAYQPTATAMAERLAELLAPP
jgi:arylsulfatase A-like enzyme